jgi:putative heme iron utilization protein
MATISDQHTADASYAPCILDDQSRTCIFISLLAKHTQNLINQPQASLLWIEDEQQATNIFARKRLTLDCSATTVARGDTAEWETLLNQFEQCHGETITLLKTLQDFQLFRFEAHQGLYVRGFGEAYPVSGNSLEVST